MNFKENESTTKLRGSYYTPLSVAQFLVRWILSQNPRKVLEPGCGNGIFIRAFAGLHNHKIQLTGIELLAKESVKARKVASKNTNLNVSVFTADFLEWAIKEIDNSVAYDAIVGNPPYIRYQYLENRDQEMSEHIFNKFNLPFTRHTNAWVPFVIASIGLLAPGGRLAMVIPSELLHVLHAGSLRKFLLSECSNILIIDPNELLFEGVLQGTVLLMVAKKTQPQQISRGVAVVAATNNDFLNTDPERIFERATYVSGDFLNGKWMKVLLNSEEIDIFERVQRLPTIMRFAEIASVDVGIVTGANKFFLVDDATVKRYRLQGFAKPMFGRSEHCPGVVYSKKVHRRNAIMGLPTNFINFDRIAFDDMPSGAQDYIREGEKQDIHTRYKCRIRTPWYSVPSVYSTDLGMLKRSHNYPRLILNRAKAYTTDTAYRISTWMKPGSLVYYFINSLTALTAELEGRHYGGGVLELVPSEIEKLLIPVINTEKASLDELDSEISIEHDPSILLAKQDAKVLQTAGLTDYECQIIHGAWLRIQSRRHRLLGAKSEERED
jgi:adenine-specific DNA methylase